jgi:uncharacterized protein YdcH (DUF465 family)
VSDMPHELPEAFPDKIEIIERLQASDADFARLAERYHALNAEIVLAESNVEPTSDLRLEDMKKRRLMMLDEIAGIVNRG